MNVYTYVDRWRASACVHISWRQINHSWALPLNLASTPTNHLRYTSTYTVTHTCKQTEIDICELVTCVPPSAGHASPARYSIARLCCCVVCIFIFIFIFLYLFVLYLRADLKFRFQSEFQFRNINSARAAALFLVQRLLHSSASANSPVSICVCMCVLLLLQLLWLTLCAHFSQF